MKSVFHCSSRLVSVTWDCRFFIKESGSTKDSSVGSVGLALWSRSERMFCDGAHNWVIPVIQTQHFQSVHCSQFCTTHQRTATDFSPSLDSSLTFSLFLTVTWSLPCLFLQYLLFAPKPFFWCFLIHLENLLLFHLLPLLGGRRLEAGYVFLHYTFCKLLLLLTILKKSASGMKATCIFCLWVTWLWH